MLGRRHEHWAPDPQSWLFRGHGDADWALLPKALRPDVSCGTLPSNRRLVHEEHQEQVRSEYATLSFYAMRLSEAGFAVPGLGASWFTGATRKKLEGELRMAINGAGPWLPESLVPLAASAQHSGLPTRLLDWSLRPLHAAYFAASYAAQQFAAKSDFGRRGPKTRGKSLAVWAVNRFKLENIVRPESRKKAPFDDFHVGEVASPWSDHPNMHAQHGVFLLCYESARDDAPVNRTSLEERLQQLISHLGHDDIFNGLFKKVTLPFTQAPQLLRFLNVEGVSYSHLFPGHEGVARAQLERRLYDE